MEDAMSCSFHPYRKNQEGICALCLQEKLGNLVSSSSSSSSFSSFRSDLIIPENGRNRIPFLKNNKSEADFRRCKSVTAPSGSKLMDLNAAKDKNKSWIRSLIHFSSPKSKKTDQNSSSKIASVPEKQKEKYTESSPTTSFERTTWRSRSVGCGSRRFSGEFLDRISTGFGDCGLRRVESNREGRPGETAAVKCGGIFGGFVIQTSSSSSSASSSYWAPGEDWNGKFGQGRGRKKGSRAVASPMRIFGKRESNRETSSDKDSSLDLDAIPSLLAVRI